MGNNIRISRPSLIQAIPHGSNSHQYNGFTAQKTLFTRFESYVILVDKRIRALNPSPSAFTPAKPGIYGISRPVTFAPNVTPGTYVEPEESPDAAGQDYPYLTPSLFPPSDLPSASTRKRCPPGKRRSQGYIPRPPNAFMLFRADFVRQKHVPGSIETNHGSLSKIIGKSSVPYPKLIIRLISLLCRQLLAGASLGRETGLGDEGKARQGGA